MGTSGPALLAASLWFGIGLGYVLLAGTGIFWAVLWPEGHALRRLRGVAVGGLVLLGLGTLVEIGLDRLGYGELVAAGAADQSGHWLLVRLVALAVAAFFGPELLRRPVRGGRRVGVLVLVLLLTATLVAESTAMVSPAVGEVLVVTGLYLVTVAAWLGGLVGVAALLVPRIRPDGLERVWSRFPWFAVASVLALAVTGAAQHLLVGGTSTARSGGLLLVEGVALSLTLLLSWYAAGHGRRLAFRDRYLRGFAVAPPQRRPLLGSAIGLQLALAAALVGVVTAQLAAVPVPGRPGLPPVADPVPTTPVTTAREARPVDAGDTRFVPERIDLAGGAYAPVVAVATVGRELVVPEDPGTVGWWDGSSYVGDDYGSTVIAGHVDSLDQGLGFFFRLWQARVGERVVLSAGEQRQAYRITRLREVPRTDLVDDEEVFAIDGPPRLVLITCAGEFRPERGGYSRNLVVVARPVR